MSPISQSCNSTLRSVFFINFKSLNTVGDALRSPWKVLEFYSYLTVWTLFLVWILSALASKLQDISWISGPIGTKFLWIKHECLVRFWWPCPKINGHRKAKYRLNLTFRGIVHLFSLKVVCFSCLLYGKQCGPRSDCSYRSSLFLVHAVCFYF